MSSVATVTKPRMSCRAARLFHGIVAHARLYAHGPEHLEHVAGLYMDGLYSDRDPAVIELIALRLIEPRRLPAMHRTAWSAFTWALTPAAQAFFIASWEALGRPRPPAFGG